MKIFTCVSQILLLTVTGLEYQESPGFCNKNSDCDTRNAICHDGQCICDNISYNGTEGCLPYATEYKAYCEESEQCDWLGPNSDCVHNQCVCSENYQWYQGSCKALADKGKSCKMDSDCYNRHDILSMRCSADSKTCICADGYYDRGFDCRKKSNAGNACALDIDCQSAELSCVLGKCSAANQTIENPIYNMNFFPGISTEKETDENDYEEISCIFDNDCRDMANSICDSATRTCRCDNNTQHLYKGNCLPGFGYCQVNTHCTDLKYSTCFKNNCVCSRGFFLSKGECIAEIGMPLPSLKTDKDCVIRPGQVVEKGGESTCVCKTYWSNDDTNRNCVKTMIQDVNSCMTNEWCEAMGPYSFCDSKTKKCLCSSFATLNESSYYCVKNGEPPEEGCLRDSGCKFNEECVDEKCQCIKNFSRHGNVCLPDIGGSCDSALCSHISNSGCDQGTCKCISNYIGRGSECYKAAKNLNDSCEIEEQCQNIKYSQCGPENDKNKTCLCRSGYSTIDDYCLKTKEYGDACMKHTDCTLVLNRSFECRNSRCQCPMGSKLKNGYCTSSSSKYSTTVPLLLLSILSLYVNSI